MNVYPTDVYGEHRVDQMSVREYFAINILQSLFAIDPIYHQ